MKQACLFLFFLISPVLLFAQLADSVINAKDSGIRKDSNHVSSRVVVHHAKPKDLSINADSISLVRIDSIGLQADTSHKIFTLVNPTATYTGLLRSLLKENRFVNAAGRPIAFVIRVKNHPSHDNFFYLLVFLATLLGLFRFFFTRYFNNLFRVFFNASLRQNQLTDQLLQSKLPSLFFNILFVFTGGTYVYLLLRYYHWISMENFWQVFTFCTLSLGVIYLIKFIGLKFTGWLTGFQKVTDTYVFVIFLINKILGIILIPFTIIIAFSTPILTTAAVIISLLFTGLMIILRFFRSYGLLQHQLKVSRLHFLMYVVGIEMLPVILIYKGLVLLLSKSL